MNSKPLYGGAITAPVPDNYLDASDIRPIPDTQEVFISPDSPASIIFDLLEPVPEEDALLSHIDDITNLHDAPFKIIERNDNMAIVEQVVPYQGSVRMAIGLIRLEKGNADAVITWNHGSLDELANIINNFKVLDWNLFS